MKNEKNKTAQFAGGALAVVIAACLGCLAVAVTIKIIGNLLER
jgi:hypothetical protein